jgi:hypothetical protein
VNQIILNIGYTNIAFSRTSSGSTEFKESLKEESHTGLQMLLKDPKLPADERTGVFNELVARAWGGLGADARKDVTGLLGHFRKGTINEDELEQLLVLIAIDPTELRLPLVNGKLPDAADKPPPAEEPTGSMSYDAIYAQLKVPATTPERRKDLVDELGIRQCGEMPQGENRNKLASLLIRHRERTLSPKEEKTLAWFLGIPEDQLAPQARRSA